MMDLQNGDKALSVYFRLILFVANKSIGKDFVMGGGGQIILRAHGHHYFFIGIECVCMCVCVFL